MLLYLIRHGHTELSDSGEIAGFTDVNLSDKGIQSVSTLSNALPNPAPELFYSSDLIRAVQTLELLASPGQPIQDPRLRELNFGDWEGLTWDEVHQRDANHLNEWSDNWLERAPPGGESFADLAKRTNDWFNDFLISAEQLSRDTSAMVVAHGGSIRALICNILQLPLDSAFKFAIDHSSVTIIKISSKGHHQCHLLNADSFQL